MAFTSSLNNQERWEEISNFWDIHTHEGNNFHHQIVAPMARRLLSIQDTNDYIDIACSTGLFARELATRARFVLGIDFSKNFIDKAIARSKNIENLQFQRIDVTNLEQMKTLGVQRFDGAVSNMALMDIEDIQTFFKGLSEILKPDARFIATLLHPSFHGEHLNFYLESTIEDNRIITKKGIKIQNYLSEQTFEQIGIIGQPIPHFCFHRPLEKLVQPAFESGFVIDAIEEKTFPQLQEHTQLNLLSRLNFPEIPAVMGLRFRLLRETI